MTSRILRSSSRREGQSSGEAALAHDVRQMNSPQAPQRPSGSGVDSPAAAYATPESELPLATGTTPPPTRIHSALAYAEVVLYCGGRPPILKVLNALEYTLTDLAEAVQYSCETIVLRAEDNQTSDEFGAEADDMERRYRPGTGSVPRIDRDTDLPAVKQIFIQVMKDAAVTCAWGYDESRSDFGNESVEEKQLRRSARIAARNAAGESRGGVLEQLKRLSVEPQEKKKR